MRPDVSGPVIALTAFLLSGAIVTAFWWLRIDVVTDERDRALQAAETSAAQVEIAQSATRVCLARLGEVGP